MNSNSLNIIFEDQEILVINKPAGITVNRSETTVQEKTVQDLVEEHLKLKVPEIPEVPKVPNEGEEAIDASGNSGVFYERSGIVHRIDKETSGILIIAKTQESFSDLQRQFKAREVKKTYLALAHGRVVPIEGEINVPVGRLPWNRRQFGVVAGGRESLTHYKVKRYFRTDDKKEEILSFVELQPFTGRTHQIRVHLQYIGHPIFSDFLYAGRKIQREDRKLLGRVFLHAANITFAHPVSGKVVTFEAELPLELFEVFDHLISTV